MKKMIIILLVLVFVATLALGAREKQEQDRVAAPKKPKQIKIVEPVYPEQAVKEKIEGLVILLARIDENGRVTKAEPIPNHEFHPLLLKAAVAAVMQWEYQPFLVDGKAREVDFSVQVNFKLNGQKDKGTVSGAAGGVIEPGVKESEKEKKASGGVVGGVVGGVLQEPKKSEKEQSGSGKVMQLSAENRPKLRKRINPIYPEEAMKAKLQGMVIIEATTDVEGKVVEARVINEPGSQPLLEEAALAAVRQWEYDPYMKDGRAEPVSFTVTVSFTLKTEVL